MLTILLLFLYARNLHSPIFGASFSVTIFLSLAQHDDVPILNYMYKALIGYLGDSRQRAQDKTYVNN